MKKLGIFILLCMTVAKGYGQGHMLSYDDFKYLLQNNISKADSFLVTKGYTIHKPVKGPKKRLYQFTEKDGRVTELQIIIDGRRVNINLETCEMLQFDVIKSSIAQFGYSVKGYDDIQAYHVKDLGDIYVSVQDTVPYSPIKKDYNITLRGEVELTVLN